MRWLRHIARQAVATAVAATFAAGGAGAFAESSTNLPVLTTVAAVRALNPEQAARGYPVELHAVVTFYNLSEYWALFVQDDTGGIFVKLTATNHVRLGDHIVVQGTTDPGDFAPMELATNIVVERSGPMPKPHQASFEELASGVDDGAWVEVQGVVRLVRPANLGRTYIEMMADGQRLSMLVTTLDPSLAARLINATVRVRGACYSRPNSRRQIRAPWLAVTDGSDIQIQETSLAEPVAVDFTNFLRYDPVRHYGQRVKVRGTVALQQVGRALYIVNGRQGLRVKTQQTTRVALGDLVEVTGFPALGQYTPILEDATFKRIERQAPPVPADVQVDQLLSDGYDAALVRLRGRLLNQVHGWRDLTLVLEANSLIFSAHLDPDEAGDERLARLENGSEVDVTGICVLQPLENWNPSINSTSPQSFQLLLRSARDVVLITRPPWWTLERMLYAIGIMSITLLAGLMWLLALDRRVRRQTQIIQDKAQREAVLEERSRIAREFHDTLEQELAAISIQLDTVSAQFEDSPAIARELLELTRNMSRRSLAEARRSVWDLRSHLLENSNLVTAISEFAKSLAACSQCQIVVATTGEQRKLAPALENNFLRLAQEALTNALKHAQATRIAIQLDYRPQGVRLEVSDDGIGFDPLHCPSIEAGHFGLLDMQERVQRMGGRLSIESQPGRGARVIVDVPEGAKSEPPAAPPTQHELPLEAAV
ncbi:MAG TPA: sensor histidine kinase [Verrucomicrobiae bacterium]|jgi:signal transduction histidine kinase|nr:sensor histidine kinase [Verrucomicrobiae bacterium]